MRKKDDLYEMDFPTYPLTEVPVTDEMEQAFGFRPDQVKLMQLEGRIQNATARGRETDCVSRSFCPKLSIAGGWQDEYQRKSSPGGDYRYSGRVVSREKKNCQQSIDTVSEQAYNTITDTVSGYFREEYTLK